MNYDNAFKNFKYILAIPKTRVKEQKISGDVRTTMPKSVPFNRT
jgi:hypothetical protein